MPRGGARKGAGRKKDSSNAFTAQKRAALQRFNDKLDEAEVTPMKLLRPEEILFMICNGMPRPDGQPWTPMQYSAAVALIPYSIAKPASVQIHQVQRSDSRQFSDEELERIAFQGPSSAGNFAAAQSPLLPDVLVRGSTGADGDETGEAP